MPRDNKPQPNILGDTKPYHFLAKVTGLSAFVMFIILHYEQDLACCKQSHNVRPTREIFPFEASSRYFVAAKFGRNNMFAEEVNQYHAVVKTSGFFPEENIFTYSQFPDFILSDPRFAQHLSFMNNSNSNPRGGGYWFWKPQIIAHHLANISMGDFLVYLDIDLKDEWWTMRVLMEIMAGRNANLATVEMQHKTRMWTKRDVYKALCPGVDISTDESRQITGNVFCLRKSPGSLRFVNDWANAVAEYQLINDEPSQSGPEVPDFKENRHDQSVVDLLLRCKYQYPGRTIHTLIPSAWNTYTYTIPDE